MLWMAVLVVAGAGADTPSAEKISVDAGSTDGREKTGNDGI